MSDEPKTGSKLAGRLRSPAYPAMSLPEAVEKAKALYEANRRNAVHLDAAMTALGYKPKSGGGLRIIAALITFGLAEDEGSGENRKVKVTDATYRLVHLAENDPDRMALLRELAVKPKIYAEMLTEWPEHLPTDAAMQKHLILARGFNAASVPTLLQDFRATYDFVGFGDRGRITKDAEDKKHPRGVMQPGGGGATWGSAGSGDSPPELPKVPVGMKTLAIPLGPESEVIVYYPANFSPGDFDFAISQMTAYKSRITVEPPPPPRVRTGQALWKAHDADHPVVVTGYAGVHRGRHYVSIEGSTTGVPLDEIEYDG